ncbi:MAG: hypothetical protein GFH27_549283n111 [Chloroflexi bacterium AL-W]|nr:hypothetical protein [Chloroflexi bacterium AL-N1]NOK64768.1 hypothetical protein [Chloroflexi bacterium AL-N10]NOK76009.1 hypothetical protein [Chloroflexi bacterium AL-N5]NOK80232.1 hypothetical protein [Chloroflexi bacterium AL-W]NOK86745.1 hypothetical protein [Chloroflexi bacterium AL-N15]
MSNTARMGQQTHVPGEETDQVTALQSRIVQLEAQLARYQSRQMVTLEHRLDTLLAICSVLIVTREVNSILDLVVRSAVELFPGTSGIMIYLADMYTKQLTLRASTRNSYTGATIHPGRGLGGRAFLAPRAMLMIDQELETALGELTPEHREQLVAQLRVWPPTSALMAPLRHEGKRLGAVVLYGGVNDHMFHPRDLPFVQALADLVSVALAESHHQVHAATLQQNLAQTQAQLLQSAKLAAVGELAASVAHEINNPLYAARNSLYLIDQEIPAEASYRPLMDIAQGELGRIARIVTRMSDFYRPTRAELQPTDVNELITDTLELVQTHIRHGRISVITDLAAELPQVTAHSDQIRQVLLNLMLNACDAMPKGGTLTTRTQLLASSDDEGEMILMQLADTGNGIPEEHLPHIFEPFYTTKASGTGLGLAISAHIATQHGGRIDVDSTVGNGTTFSITLPVKTSMD